MDTTTLYLAAKTVHIAAFVLAIGIVACTYMSYSYFWELYGRNKEQGISAFRAYNRLQLTGMISLGVVLLAGIAMLVLMDWRLMQHLWFQVKLALVALIFINGFTLGRTSTIRLRRFLEDDNHDSTESGIIKRKLRFFQLLQLALYFAIIVVSVFRAD